MKRRVILFKMRNNLLRMKKTSNQRTIMMPLYKWPQKLLKLRYFNIKKVSLMINYQSLILKEYNETTKVKVTEKVKFITNHKMANPHMLQKKKWTTVTPRIV
jgi:hypothetical protein